jgi:hypothetical protein
MLISKKEISTEDLPLLMQTTNGDWKLVSNIITTNVDFSIEILEKNNDKFAKRVISQPEPPFYVGADVWELDYGATLMTLSHETLKEHPASQLWQDWNETKQANQ